MKEQFSFDGEAAALRAELVERLVLEREINQPRSPETRELLIRWTEKGEQLVDSGELDNLEWTLEVARVYIDAGLTESAITVLKTGLYEAQGSASVERNVEMENLFRSLLKDLGDPDPDDFSSLEENF